jgi:hypothetical protein
MEIRRGQFMLDVARQTTSPRKERQRWDIYSGSFALFSADARNSYRRGACVFLAREQEDRNSWPGSESGWKRWRGRAMPGVAGGG